ncbi:zinc-binding dehydrogenase [Xylariaceae sp. FL1272]|nr:zinc-binding dehydrogenase [Xylariaceae sp. FL1272]
MLSRTTQRAVVQDSAGLPTIVNNAAMPTSRPDYILVKVLAVALNPSDNKMGTAFPIPGAVIGMDFVGRVVEVVVTEEANDLAVGDLVCGATHGSNPGYPSNGSFAEYVRAPAGLVLRVPDGFPLTEAAALGLPLLTNSVALWGSMRIRALPREPIRNTEEPVLVYGGSTASGTMAIQLLRIAGYNPIATCSARHFDMVKSYGACAVFDYTSEIDLGASIRNQTRGRLRHALDCVADQASTSCCYASLGRPGGQYTHLEAIPTKWKTRKAVKAEIVLAYEAFGDSVNLPGEYNRPADLKRHNIALALYTTYQGLLDDGILHDHPVEVIGSGFEKILEGLDQLKQGMVSGKRLVVWLDEEPKRRV